MLLAEVLSYKLIKENMLNTHIFSFRTMLASAIGTVLEWYDFSLFAFLTPILANLFFPHENKLTAMMLMYTIFAIGFFARPLGAMLFGHLGDRIGRKKTLVLSILLMSVPTFCIGVLPTYEKIGILAPVLLILFRICQGLSVGGETTGAILFVLESSSNKKNGLTGGFLWAMTAVGMLLGSFAATLVAKYAHIDWVWRIPFLLGIFTGFIGYFVRKHAHETTAFNEIIKQNQRIKFPLLEGIIKFKKELLIIMGIYLLSAMITYLIFIFMPSYAAKIIGMPLEKVTWISTLALAGSILLVPIGGWVSDVVGRKNCLRWGALGFLLLSYPLYQLIVQGSLQSFIIAESIFVVLAACFQGPIPAFVLEQLPTRVRYSTSAVGYNVSYSLFGGTAPLFASYIVELTGNKAMPGLYLMLGACIALIAISYVNSARQLQYA